MKRRPVVIVFVRAPMLGAVKSRLAAGIGQVAALRFYRETTRRLLQRIGRDPRWVLHLAVTPDDAAMQGRHWPGNFARFPQGTGDLGVRMARAMQRFRHCPVLLVGSDVPDIAACHIDRAFRALGRNDLVFGPATDGGYWLVGARDSRMVRGIFRNVRWSGAHALTDTVANASGRSVAYLDPLDDVDTPDDYLAWQRRKAKE